MGIYSHLRLAVNIPPFTRVFLVQMGLKPVHMLSTKIPETPQVSHGTQNDGFQVRNLLFQGAIYRFHVKYWEQSLLGCPIIFEQHLLERIETKTKVKQYTTTK